MSKAYDSLPWLIRTKAELFLNYTPKWYQKWSNKRSFWKHIEEGVDSKTPWDCICRAMAAAELNRRLGDDSLIKKFHPKE